MQTLNTSAKDHQAVYMHVGIKALRHWVYVREPVPKLADKKRDTPKWSECLQAERMELQYHPKSWDYAQKLGHSQDINNEYNKCI